MRCCKAVKYWLRMQLTKIKFKGHQSNGLSAKRNERRDMLEMNLIPRHLIHTFFCIVDAVSFSQVKLCLLFSFHFTQTHSHTFKHILQIPMSFPSKRCWIYLRSVFEKWTTLKLKVFCCFFGCFGASSSILSSCSVVVCFSFPTIATNSLNKLDRSN